MNRTAISMMAQKGYDPKTIAHALGIMESLVLEVLGETPPPLVRTVVWDLETTNLRADIGSLLMGSFLDTSTGSITTHMIEADPSIPIQDREATLVQKVRAEYESADILIGWNSKAFDKNFLNGILARHGLGSLSKRFHIDGYLVARYGLKGLLQSYSLDNMADFFNVGVKDRPSKHDWREAALLSPDSLEEIRERCESDVELTAKVWEKLRPYWLEWKGH